MIKFFNLIGLATAAAAVVALTQDVSAAVLMCTADDRVTIFVRILLRWMINKQRE